MTLQLWETLKESIVASTGLSPATFFTILALGLAVYYVVSGLFGSLSHRHQRPRNYQEQMKPLPPPVQLVETSEDELNQYDGTDPKKSLLMANRGQIYDVSQSRRSYDVFLSFRGTDVRNNFLGHLYIALDQRGINAYIDSEELRKGEQISPTLMEAIKESQIAIVVFSENYASSKWCLDELAEIMECKEQRNLVVFPVFYKVEPREVRTPGKGDRQSYGKAMAEHEVNFGKDSEKVKRWKKALSDVGSLSGWHVTENEYEAGLIQDIVQKISTQLDRTPLNVAKYPVGIDSRVQELQTILNLQSKDDILMVGLWGQGGIGKTTLAKAIYNASFREFQGSSFLDRVSENSKSFTYLVHLQKKLLSQVLRKELIVFSVDKGSQLIQDRLSNKKVLIILDDVDDEHQLNALAGDCKWFGKGSRIIITTRNKHLLTSHGVYSDQLYKVTALMRGEALELFRKHAFLRSQKIEIRSNLVDSVLHYAQGLPLALEVLGSFLCGRGEHQWESTLEKLAKSPHKEINDVLKVSYDGLEDDVKEVFLDIACFFKGQETKYIREVLDSCDFDMTIGVEILIERSLISEEGRTLQMHDLIKWMGMEIVKKECCDDAGKRSRLWLYDDVLDVLSGDVGTDAIKAIALKLPKFEETSICPNAFTNMRKLRLLILHNVGNSLQGPIHLPSQLRCLELHDCDLIPEFGYGRKRLVRLDMQNSKIKELPKFKDFEKLKFINMSGCQLLVRMLDLNLTPNLEELYLVGCKNLELVHESIAYHGKLRFLKLDGCSKLQSLPDIPVKNEALRKISLNETGIKELPASIKNFVSLEDMSLNGNRKLVILPSTIYNMQNLQKLSLQGCSRLKFPKDEEDLREAQTKTRFPMLEWLNLNWCNLSEVGFLENLSQFPRLKNLLLLGNDLTKIPTWESLSTWERLYSLENLDASHCKRLQEIPKIPGKLRSLNATYCKSLNRIPCNICDVEYVLLHSCREPVRHWFPVNDLFKPENCHCQTNCRIILPGGEMPEWLISNTEGYLSFMASKDTYKKILGVVFCIVFQAKTESSFPEDSFPFELMGIVNCICKRHSRYIEALCYDHVWLEYMESKDLWMVDHFGPNELSHFHISIRLACGYTCRNNDIIVKKCGFRLICKSPENDLEVLLQENQLLDPTLLYEVSHEDNPTSIKEESSSETGHLSETYLKKRGFNMADFSIEKHRFSNLWSSDLGSRCREVHPGREMPKEFVLVEDGTISFMASQGLYNSLAALHFCVVFGVDGKKEVSIDIVPHVNGQRRNMLSGTLGSFDTDHVWFQLFLPSMLWGVLEGAVDFGQFDESYLNFSLNIRVAGATVKKLGYVIQSYLLEDALKVELEEHRLMDQASLLESNNHPFYYGSQRGYY